jgi:DNA-directed RNA polymerase subunit H (RpoH/RPB5)
MSFRKRGGESGGSKLTSSTPLINVELIYHARINLLNQLRQRGFDVSDYENFSTHEVHSMFSSGQMDMLLEKNDDDREVYNSGYNAKRVYVKYLLEKALRPQKIYETIDELYQVEEVLDKEQGDEVILILPSEPNDTVIEKVNIILEADDIIIRPIYMKRLLYNVLEHSLVPQHRILTKNETNEIMKKYNMLDLKQFPEISKYDPVAQTIGMRPNDVCEIIRPSKTAIQAQYYRRCV